MYVNSVQKGNKVPNYILLIYLDVNFVINIECKWKEMKNSKCYSISILSPSNIHSTVWLQAPHSTCLSLHDLAPSFSVAHTPQIYLYVPNSDFPFFPIIYSLIWKGHKWVVRLKFIAEVKLSMVFGDPMWKHENIYPGADRSEFLARFWAQELWWNFDWLCTNVSNSRTVSILFEIANIQCKTWPLISQHVNWRQRP